MINALLSKLWSIWGRLLHAVPGTSMFGTWWGKLGAYLRRKKREAQNENPLVVESRWWGSVASWLFLTGLIAGLILITFSNMGCSAVKKVATEITHVQNAATGIRSDVVEARQNLRDGNLPAVDAGLVSIDDKAETIQRSTARASRELTQVQDIVPYWQKLMRWGFIAAVVLAGVFVAWRLNLFILLEKGIQKTVDVGAKIAGA